MTYRRAWALPHSLASIANQTRKPDEVLVVLRPSGDDIEEVIEKFSSQLPIRLILQKKGNCAYTYQLAIDNASGDHAVAEMQWVEKYVQLFDTLPKAGGVGPHVQGISKKRRCRQDAGGDFMRKPPRGRSSTGDLFRNTRITQVGFLDLGTWG